jgi:hypothetical protein
MALADKYLSGDLPTRFMGMGTVTMVDLYENGIAGQFLINNPFPGLDKNVGANDTDNFATQITGTLVVNTPGPYDFFTDTNDGNRFRLDIDRDGIFEDFGDLEGNPAESIVPDGGVGNTAVPERSRPIVLAEGNYMFEITTYELTSTANADAGYRSRTLGQPIGRQHVLGDASGGIGLLAPATVRTVGADLSAIPGGPDLLSFSDADALRTSPNEAGFPVRESREVFNMFDSDTDGHIPGGMGVPGLGDPGATDDDDFLVVGSGFLVVPTGGITGAVFSSTTDDGGRLLIDVNRDGDLLDVEDTIIYEDRLQNDHTMHTSRPVTLPAGNYKIEYSFFERDGGASGEVAVSLDGDEFGEFTLLGDNAAVLAGTGLDVVGPPVTGDFNGDGVVAAADYDTWKQAFGNMVGPGTGADASGNGIVDTADYVLWRDNLETTAGAALGLRIAVPEPAAWVLGLVSLLLAARRLPR